MGLRPGRCYRRLERPYTRQSQRKPRKSYIKGVPRHKIAQFESGVPGEYDKSFFLLSQHPVQIRHNALEAARISANQRLEKDMPKGSKYFMKIRVYPHHVLRENALATGAGADRFQQGMRANFGKPIGTAARVKKGQRLIEVRVPFSGVKVAKLALKAASYKLPVKCKIEEG